MLQLSPSVAERLERLADEAYPQEACGLLVGKRLGDARLISSATAARNLSQRAADRYVLDPDHYLAADARARRDGLEILGIWHTHPDHPAEPSTTDLDRAWEGFAYLILAVDRNGVVDRRCWDLEGEAFEERPLSIKHETTPTGCPTSEHGTGAPVERRT